MKDLLEIVRIIKDKTPEALSPDEKARVVLSASAYEALRERDPQVVREAYDECVQEIPHVTSSNPNYG